MSNSVDDIDDLAQQSCELVVGIVGYAGSGCSALSRKLKTELTNNGYKVEIIKLSKLIEQCSPAGTIPVVDDNGERRGNQRVDRAVALQDAGDTLRKTFGNHCAASLAIKEIRKHRNGEPIGHKRIAFILDSIKHKDEVYLLRKLYEDSFRLVAVHCELEKREFRLIGDASNPPKFEGAEKSQVLEYMRRDEKDKRSNYGQGVRDAFYLADFFLNNNEDNTRLLSGDINRFVKLLLGAELVNPSREETGMYMAHSAALSSSCLSRQVGAALQCKKGNLVSIGKNEVPKFGGGTYHYGDSNDSRCHLWEWKRGEQSSQFTGCHNARSKKELETKLASWAADTFPNIIQKELDLKLNGDNEVNSPNITDKLKEVFLRNAESFSNTPEIGDLIEYSRSIHAEMDAIMSASRSGVSTEGGTLYCTTFPCHNCARHLVTAGIHKVLYIEPYVKSRALELHGDSLATNEIEAFEETDDKKVQIRMIVTPFTGVGPRMYEDHFMKNSELKDDNSGAFIQPGGTTPVHSVRLRDLAEIEKIVADNALTPKIEPTQPSNDQR